MLAPSVVPEFAPTSLALPPIDVSPDRDSTIIINPDTGAVHTQNDDGSITISFGRETGDGGDTEFDDNLADKLPESELNEIADTLMRGIEEDIASRREWEDTFNRGLDLLGLKLEDASSDVSAQGSVSKVYHPLLIEAVVRYQATASAELLPSAGPVKCRDDNPLTDPSRVQLAEEAEAFYNDYLTVRRREYYPDSRKMLFAQGFCGNGFKKVYRCPIRKAPVSDYVAAKDLIVSSNAVSLHNVSRKTQRINMRHSVMKRLQLSGHFRKCDLVQPNSQPTTTDEKIGRIEGIMRSINIPADHPYTLYECYTEYDIASFPHKDNDNEQTGLPLSYRITLDKDSRKILEIRRNWKRDDEDYRERQRFVKYGYIPGFGFYDYGLVHLLGQTTRALTAIERQLIDAGQFSNFPGFLLSDAGGVQETTQIRISPGGSHTIKTGGLPIGQVVMNLPYKDPSAVLVSIAAAIEANGRRLGSTAEVQVGEGRADMPVGTTLALIEQSTKLMAAVHKQNHESQTQEFMLLKELFEEEPTGMWNPAYADIMMVPASDPNTPSHIHRVMQAQALVQLSQMAGADFNRRAVESIVLTTLGYSPAAILTPAGAPTPPPGDPAKMAKVQVEQAKIQERQQSTVINAKTKMQEIQATSADAAAERQSRENVQRMKTEGALAQQKSQQQIDLMKHDRQNIGDTIRQGLSQNHEADQQAREQAHEKDVANMDNSMLSSDE